MSTGCRQIEGVIERAAPEEHFWLRAGADTSRTPGYLRTGGSESLRLRKGSSCGTRISLCAGRA
jgi:hypothetical protein